MIQLRAINTLLCTSVTLINILWTTEINWTKYEFEDASNRFSRASTEYLFIKDNVNGSFACSKICFMHNNCLIAEFNPDKFQCIGCTVFSFQHLPWSENSILLSRRDYRIDCKDVLAKDEHAKSGIYEIRLNILERIDVFCDMETEGGGWTIIQRRFGGSVDFNKTFAAYEKGFGDMDGEFWLVAVHNELLQSYSFHDGAFHTYDKDSLDNCGRLTGGGWWFPPYSLSCIDYNLNGKKHSEFSYFVWLKGSSMMVRRP